MSFLYSYYKTVVKQDLLTKFSYVNFDQIPAIKKICLNFQVTQSSLKQLLPLMSALTLISSQKSFLLTSNKSNLILKLKKGVPVGCKVTIRKKGIYFFLERFLFLVLSQSKGSSIPLFRIGKKNAFLTLENLFFFKEVEKEYENFQYLPELNITMVINSKKEKEILSLLSALKFPIKNKEKND